jgi:hypothetical protein
LAALWRQFGSAHTRHNFRLDLKSARPHPFGAPSTAASREQANDPWAFGAEDDDEAEAAGGLGSSGFLDGRAPPGGQGAAAAGGGGGGGGGDSCTLRQGILQAFRAAPAPALADLMKKPADKKKFRNSSER